MTGNVFRRNIISYTDPRAPLLRMEGVPLEHNQSDFNLIHHAGQPLRTGVTVARTEIGPNLLRNAGLEEGEVGQPPKHWHLGVFPGGAARVRVVSDQAHEGARSALVELATPQTGKRVSEPVFLTLGSRPYQPGKAYRLRIWMKCAGEGAPVELCALSWKKDTHSWQVQSTAALTPEWRQYELSFRLPAPGDPDYAPTMDVLMWRVNLTRGTTTFWFDDAALTEAELLDEWQGWQALGMDKHSLVADPLFVDPARDNYRLQPESPAFQLGFQPIPFEKIGPYPDALRASWPIVEAPGVREAQQGR
jgi:hypothetical protein